MVDLHDVRDAATVVVNDVCGGKVRSFGEAEVGRILHAFLIGQYTYVTKEYKVRRGKKTGAIDFRFGNKDEPRCLLELAVRNSENGSQFTPSQNKSELKKLSKYSISLKDFRVLLLLDIGHEPLSKISLRDRYSKYEYENPPTDPHNVRVLYVHRNLTHSFVWYPLGHPPRNQR